MFQENKKPETATKYQTIFTEELRQRLALISLEQSLEQKIPLGSLPLNTSSTISFQPIVITKRYATVKGQQIYAKINPRPYEDEVYRLTPMVDGTVLGMMRQHRSG